MLTWHVTRMFSIYSIFFFSAGGVQSAEMDSEHLDPACYSVHVTLVAFEASFNQHIIRRHISTIGMPLSGPFRMSLPYEAGQSCNFSLLSFVSHPQNQLHIMAPNLLRRSIDRKKPPAKSGPKPLTPGGWYTSGFGVLSGFISNRRLPSEQAKAPFTKSLWPRLLQAFIHCIPIGITASLVTISLRNVYWYDPGAPYITTKLQAFQFGAKIYDVFICWSLATMMLYVLRANLPGGIKLGSLATSYDATNTGTFFSSLFWAGVSRHTTKSSAVLTVVLTLVALTAAISSPLAAILLIPKLQWWPVSDIQAFAELCTPPECPEVWYQINANDSVLWPSHLDHSNLPDTSCLLAPDKQDDICPGHGFEALLSATTYYPTKNDGFGFDLPSPIESLNLSMLETATSRTPFIRPLTSHMVCLDYYETGDIYGVVTSTPSLPLSSLSWNAFRGEMSTPISGYERPRIDIHEVNGHPPLKPFVQVRCNFQNETSLLQFPSAGFATPGFAELQVHSLNGLCSTWASLPNIYRGQAWTLAVEEVVNTSALDSHIRDKSIHLSWVDLSRYPTRPSLAAAIFFPNCNSSYGPYEVATCSIDARWLPTTMQIDPRSDISIRGSPGSNGDLARSLAKSNNSDPIYIGLDWAAALNTQLPTTGSSNSSKTAAEAILSKGFNFKEGSCDGWTDSWTDGIPVQVLEAQLGFIIADGLARIGGESNYSTTGSWGDRSIYSRNGTYVDSFYMYETDKVTMTAQWSNVTLRGYRYGYGWGLDTSTSIIAAVVLLFHTFLALLAIAALLIKRVVSTRWATSGEVLALALRSTPSEKAKLRLKNVGAGIDRLDTWKETVATRVDGDGNLQLVFVDESDERGLLMPKADERYG